MIINFTIKRVVNVSKVVCLWNTWDHEHLYYVHRQFGNAKMMYEDSKVAFIRTTVKLPFLPIYVNCLHTMTSIKNDNVLVIDALPFGVISKLEMIYNEIDPRTTELVNNYSLDVPVIFYPFKDLICRVITRWNDVNWEEDLPLKMRRQLAIDSNFVDFYGKSDKAVEANKQLKLPIPRTKDSILNN
jgi:hypothetical protein